MPSSAAFLLKIKIALAAGLLLMAVVGAASYVAISRLIETAQSRVRTEDTLVMLERVDSSLRTAESTLRQYLLSGSEDDLKALNAPALTCVRSGPAPAAPTCCRSRRTSTH
jgi:CHASE3 domain sensor protein